MAEPLAVDPTGLSAAAAKLAGLVFPQPPAPIAVSGTDSVVAAINETMPSIESLVSDGLPGVKAALTRTASNMNAAADVYAKTDQSLGTSLSQYAFGSSGEGLAGVASVGGQPSQATQLLSTPVSQVTTQLGETAAELAPRVVATVPQLVQLAPHAVQMSQNASPTSLRRSVKPPNRPPRARRAAAAQCPHSLPALKNRPPSKRSRSTK